MKRPIGTLDTRELLGVLLDVGFALPFDGEHTLVHLDLDRIQLNTWDVRV